MSQEVSNNNFKWVLGIVTFVIWLIGVRIMILSEWQSLGDIFREESYLSTGQQWAMILFAIALIVIDIKVYKALKET